ncbi:hypothetical protein MRX96_046738 [Rhipicephalus microplus]
MRVEVNGCEISPEKCMTSQGLNLVLRVSQEGTEAMAVVKSRGNHLDYGATSSDTTTLRVKRTNESKISKGVRKPDLPRDRIKIGLSSRGGLHVSDVTRVELSCAIAAGHRSMPMKQMKTSCA